MQKLLFSGLLALALGTFSVSAQTECFAGCFLASYPDLANGCPEDPTYVKCICKDPSKFPAVKTCLGKCTDTTSQQVASDLDPSICVASTSSSEASAPTTAAVSGGASTVTVTVSAPCSTGSEAAPPPPPPPPPTEETSTATVISTPPEVVTTSPVVIPPPTGVPTGGVQTPGGNTTVSTQLAPTMTAPPPAATGGAGIIEFNSMIAGLVGVVGIFMAL